MLAVFGVTYMGASMASSLNIGYRHLLPVVPALYLLAGAWATVDLRGGARALRQGRPAPPETAVRFGAARGIALALLCGLAVWQAVGTVRLLPYPLGFYNELAGGPANGWRYLADSNTDWGQGYKALAAYQASAGIPSVKLAAFIFYDPAAYGVTYTPLTPLGGDTPAIFPARFAPPPGDYVISATPLDGIPLADPEMYDWFRWRAPDAMLAYAMPYYHVTAAETTVAWLAQCTQPVAPLSLEAIAAGLGDQQPRLLTFDCAQSWLYPQGAGGLTAIHGALLTDSLRARLHLAAPAAVDPFVGRALAPLTLVYRQRDYRASPAFALYRSPGQPEAPGGTAWAAPAEAPLNAATGGTPQAFPLDLDGPLRFLGAESHADGKNIEVETWWEVTGTAGGRPLSLMGHLLGPDGTVLATADGLGVDPGQWLPGDVIVQRHRFGVAASSGYVLRTGAYWLDTGERWGVAGGGGDAIFVALDGAGDVSR